VSAGGAGCGSLERGASGDSGAGTSPGVLVGWPMMATADPPPLRPRRLRRRRLRWPGPAWLAFPPGPTEPPVPLKPLPAWAIGADGLIGAEGNPLSGEAAGGMRLLSARSSSSSGDGR